jgi:quinol monooxygenase YgiN
VLVTGEYRLPPESHAAAREAMARVIAASRAESGCREYAYAEDVIEAGLFRVVERWESRDALTAHFATAHMLRWIAEREALGLTGRRVVAWQGGTPQAL